MIQLRVLGGNFDPIIAMLDRMARPDLGPLAESLREIMIRDNREGLLAGTNADGSKAADLAESTIKRGRGGDGPPRVPRDASSRMIDDYRVEIQETDDRLVLIGGWRTTPFVRFHQTGAPKHNMPARDPVGIRPEGQDSIRKSLDDFASSLIGDVP